jgi:hypothetical protein
MPMQENSCLKIPQMSKNAGVEKITIKYILEFQPPATYNYLSDDCRGVIYDCNIFIIQANGGCRVFIVMLNVVAPFYCTAIVISLKLSSYGGFAQLTTIQRGAFVFGSRNIRPNRFLVNSDWSKSLLILCAFRQNVFR